MSDVNANINISIDSSQALGQLRALQSQISKFNESVIAGNVAAAAAQKNLTANLAAQVNATKGFSTSITNVESGVSRLNRSIEKNKLSLGQYFRYGVASSGAFGKSMREHAEIMDLAGDRVKRLQTQYVALGQTQQGMTRAMAMRPLQLHNADAAISIQRQQIFNKLMHDGSTAMVNWGKNTQWAGRQLMVGFTVPLTIFGGVAGKIFMDLEKQIVQFKRVYGDLQTPAGEKAAMVEEVKALGKEFTKYGIAVNDTIALAAKAAATGATGADLMAVTTEATRLATLGQIDYQQALDATISLQTAFRISSGDLAQTTDFLNAVENQTVTSLDDITQAIPLVAPVIKGLGGDVKDLAIFMTAMREGGVSANEGANALKSGLASLINPTKAARDQLSLMKIDIDSIAANNKGDIQGFVLEFGKALETLDKFERQQTLAKVFGKYQFARMGALFSNISKEGSQAQRVVELTGASVKELAALSQGELGQLEEAVGVKFTAAVEKLKLAIAPVGEAFLKIATPIIDFATTIAEKFNELPEGMKSMITWGVAIGGVVVPTVIMLVGLFANFLGNMVKMGNAFRMLMARVRGGGSAFNYLESEELDAMAASASLEGQTHSLTGALNVQRGAVQALARSYGSYVAGANAAAGALPQGFRGPARRPRRYATGGFVAGSGNKDTEPALLTPGEFVVSQKAAQENADILHAINAGTISRYAKGSDQFAHIGRPLKVGVGDLSGISGGMAGTGMFADIKAMAATFGNTVKAILYPSLGFTTTGSINNRLDKSGVPKEEFLADWDSRGTKKWSTSLSRAGLKLQDVEEDLIMLDKTMRDQIASSKEITMVTDKVVDQMYQQAATKLPAGSKLGAGFGGLRNKFAEMRANVSARMFEKFNIPIARSGSRFSGTVGDRYVRSSHKVAAHKSGGIQRSALMGIGAQELESTSERAGKKAADAVGDGAGTHSPSKITQQQGKDVAKGLEIGIQQGTPGAVAAAEKMGAQVAQAADPNAPVTATGRRGRRGATRPQGAPNYRGGVRLEGGNQNTRNAPKTRGHAAMLAAGDGMTQQFVGAGKQAEETGGRLKGLGGKLAGGMMAMDGLLFGMSMMDNAVGDFAQQIMPAAFAAQGLAMMLPMLTNPLGIAVAAVAAFGAGFAYLAKQSADLSARAQAFSDAMVASTDAMNGIAEAYGRETIASQMASKQKKREYGVTKKQDQESQKFISSDTGQAMRNGLDEAISTMGSSNAASQFANNLSSMVLQGAIGPKQAKALALAMGDSLGNQTFGIVAEAELAKIIGPNGKDISKNPIKVAIEIDKNNQEFVGQMSQMLNSSGAQKAVNSYAWNVGQDSMFGAAARGLRGLFDSDYENAVAQYQALGGVIGNQMSQSYDNLTAAKTRYKDMSEQAANVDKNDANAKAEAEANAIRAKRGLDMLTKSIESQKQAYVEMFRAQGGGSGEAQDTILTGMEQSILKQYESDPMMKSAWDMISGKIGAVDKELRFKVYTELQSGALDPMTMQNLIGMYGDNAAAASSSYMSLVFAVKGDSKLATQVLQGLMGNGLSAGEMMSVKAQVEIMGLDAIREYNDLLLVTSQIADESIRKTLVIQGTDKSVKQLKQINKGVQLYLGLPDKLLKEIDVNAENATATMQSFGKFYSNVDQLQDIEKYIKANDQYSSVFDAFGVTYAEFNALPNINKALVMTYMTQYLTVREEFDKTADAVAAATAAQAAAGGNTEVPNGAVKGKVMQLAQQGRRLQEINDSIEASLDIPAVKPKEVETPGATTPKPTGGDGSGGGEKEKTWLEQKIEELKAMEKLYTTAGKNGSKLVASQGFFFGIIEKLRSGRRGKNGNKKMPTIPQFIIDSLGEGPEGLKNAMQLMNLSEKALKKFVSLSKKTMVGQFVETKKKEATAIKQKGWVKKILEESGVAFSKEEVDQILSDQSAIDAILASAGKKRKEVLDSIRASMEPEAAEVDKESELSKLIDMMNQGFDNLEDAKREEFAKKVYTAEGLTVKQLQEQIDSKNDLIELQQDIVDGKQEEIDDLQHLNDLDQQKIDDYNREIEMQQRKIEGIQREDEIRNRMADALSNELDLMSRQEQAIRDAYQKRISALDEVARLNERIAEAQQDQLAISKALSVGDVYAAAQAAAQMQANQVRFASEQTKKGLEAGMENAVGGITSSSGLTRAQIEQQIQSIKDQSYQTSLQIREIEDYIYNLRQTKILPLEDGIFNRNLQVRDLTNQIYTINETMIEPLQNQIDAYERIISDHETLLEQQVKDLILAEMTREEWERKSQSMLDAIQNAKDLTPELEAIAGKYDKIREAAEAAAAAAAKVGGGVPPAPNKGGTTTFTNTGTSTPSTSTATWHPYGAGMVGGWYAAGGVVGDGARDSVSAMLSPGEFVIRKASVDKYGMSMFEKINQGSFTVPRYTTGTSQTVTPVASMPSSTNINAPVYNSYSVNVTANTSSSADDIARTVIAKIKTIENSNIRRINGY